MSNLHFKTQPTCLENLFARRVQELDGVRVYEILSHSIELKLVKNGYKSFMV